MTPELKALLSSISESNHEHQRDLGHLRRIVSIAELGNNAEEVGAALLEICEGDFEQVRLLIESYTRIASGCLMRWAMTARITDLENKGELG